MAADHLKQNRVVPLDKLTPHPRNYRQHPEGQVSKLVASLARFGQGRSIVIQDGPEGYLIVAGHGIVEAAKKLKYTELRADILPANWSSEEVEGYLVADNLHSQDASDDETMLAAILQEQQDAGFDLASMGTDDEALRQLLEGLGDEYLGNEEDEEDEEEEFDATPQDGPTRTHEGEMWVLGKHLLLVGDCTKAKDVDLLFGGSLANIAVTSPPYASQRRYDEKSGFKPISPELYCSWFESIQSLISEHLAPDGSFFLNIKEHSEDNLKNPYVKELVLAHVRQWGWKYIDEFCWTHQGYPGAWLNHFKNAWEPVYHFARVASIKFRPQQVSHVGDTSFRYNSSLSSVSGAKDPLGGRFNLQPDSVQETGLVRPSNVLDISTGGGKTTGEHPAEYPIDLPEFFIKAFTDKGDIVYEPFGGAGSTLIACERTDRICRIIEISPRFCDVILRRWEAETNQTATLLERVEEVAHAR